MTPDLEYEERSPPPALAGLIRCVWRLRGSPGLGPSPRVQPIVPDGCPEIVLNLADPFVQRSEGGRWVRQPRSMFVGQLTRPALVGPSGHTDIVGIRFTPWGVAHLFEIPVAELREVFLPLDAVVHGGMESLVDRLACNPAASWSETVFDHLCERTRVPLRDRRTVHIVEAIHREGGRITIRSLARRLHMGERHLQRIMRREVGLPPLVLARIIRMQGALRSMMEGSVESLSDLAVTSGYFDQPHFVREFRRLVGCTPSEFRNGDYGLTEHFVSTHPDG